ncbi:MULTISPECIES: hypothetical protein [unclassified Micromonospora]|uniref:hypothetical protein n=1 Tax=unclassified Micromonospora TaxID=2617518 RepID=UPI00188FD440|nr:MULTISPECIES: hypothetical protein [unclassified Micromonospora]MBF5030006.1 hypothetical protein [Micromonospora sp. ANENR4]MBU8860487.1 hypothetical protein [Micromonospora sp. WMMB482]MCZ7474978.1 hypothetical protein [Micromonospora sp. WMMC273]MDM4780024.1 hypothetical protein [Micromonospora sp. b486]WBC05599.1 hypothetical protein O7546_11760 [Micromonospora sp. WMMA1976]
MTDTETAGQRPGAGTLSFARDIRPLFREMDVAEMTFLLDLTSLDDVRDYAESILERVADGSMPCDAPWEAEKVELFRNWIAQGMAA